MPNIGKYKSITYNHSFMCKTMNVWAILPKDGKLIKKLCTCSRKYVTSYINKYKNTD